LKKAALLLFVITSFLHAQNADEIVRKSNDNIMGKTSKATAKMTIIRPDWSREVSMKMWSKGTEYFLIYITAPAREKGQVFLKRQNELWNWMPSIGRMIKLPPSMMMQSWMGSDFTNDDLLKQSSIVKDYTHKILREEKSGGYDCYVIEFTPKPDAAVVWGKIIMWISKDKYLQMKAEYFDETDELMNTMTASKVKDVGDRFIPTHMEMVPADEPGNKTIFEYSDIKFNLPINESFFSKQNMKRVR
jgi:outer membrane lipoprotein-sorting protein